MSCDSRWVPHTVVVTVGVAPKTIVFSVEKASELIDEGDVRLSVRANALRLGASNALTT